MCVGVYVSTRDGEDLMNFRFSIHARVATVNVDGNEMGSESITLAAAEDPVVGTNVF